MKKANRLVKKICTASLLTLVTSVFAIPVMADQLDMGFASTTPLLLASASATPSSKPPVNRHAQKKADIETVRHIDASLHYTKYKPPFKRYTVAEEHSHPAMATQVDQVLKGAKPPFKRN